LGEKEVRRRKMRRIKGKLREKTSLVKRKWTLKDEEEFNHQVPVAKAGETAEVRKVR